MRKDVSKMTIMDVMEYLEELDYQASVMNKSTSELLMKERAANRIGKEVFTLMNNTLQSMKNGEVRLNGEVVRPYEKSEKSVGGIQFAVPLDEAIPVRSGKEMGGWLDNLPNWEVERFNEKGTEFVSVGGRGDRFSYDPGKRMLSIGQFTYRLGTDFDHVLNVQDQGIYLFRKVSGKLEGVAWIREAV